MGRSSFDYDFNGAAKPCGEYGQIQQSPHPPGSCVGVLCQWYDMCDLSQKDPWKEATLPKVGRMKC